MIQNHVCHGICGREAKTRLVGRLLRDETAATSLEFLVAGAILALAAVVTSRMIAGVLASCLYRIHVVATLVTP